MATYCGSIPLFLAPYNIPLVLRQWIPAFQAGEESSILSWDTSLCSMTNAPGVAPESAGQIPSWRPNHYAPLRVVCLGHANVRGSET